MKSLKIGLLLILFVPLFACGDRIVGWPSPDETAPAVTSTSPEDGATDVAVDTVVAATFSELMDPRTISSTSFRVLNGATQIDGDVTYSDLTVTFEPDEALDEDVTYEVVIAESVSDAAGNTLAQDYRWTFTTEILPDSTRPEVVATTPVDDAVDVDLTTEVTATFSEAMDPSILTATTFTVQAGNAPVSGDVTYSDRTATFSPDEVLSTDTVYTASISGVAADLEGNTLASSYTWTFTTSELPDITAPVVIDVAPADSESDVALNTQVVATFSEAMDPATLTELTFEVTDGVAPVPGVVSYVGLSATFSPDDDLDADTEYTAMIDTGATDLSGNALAADYVWSFTTGPVPDTELPRVTSTKPIDDETGVAPGSSITAVFSEAMDPATITTTNFTVQQGANSIAGTVTYVGRTAVFSPAAPLSTDTTYSATVTTSAQDLAGNGLSEDHVWNFRTGAADDTTRPSVISTIPDDLETDVFLDADVTARFSEAMDPLTLTTASFTLDNGALPVTGTVALVGDIVTFDADVSLLPDTEYTATITSAAADLAGNTLAADYVWTFTTGVALDTQPPTVTLTTPADLDTDVALNASVNATFSEPMRPLTISTATFTLEEPDGTQVLGTVSYDVATAIATFSAGDDLLANTTYTATVTTGVADLSGNTKVMDFVWTFTTGAAVVPGMQPVNLGSLSSFVAVAGAGLTNSNSGGTTVLNGDVGLSPTATCVGDGSPCSITNPVINGTLYANDPGGIAALAKADLTAAYNDATSRPPGTTVNDVSGMVLAPGVYTSGSTMSIAVGGTVTLDGQGDADSVFIFQVGSSLTVNDNASVLLINGASAKNVFWAVGASSTLGTNVDFSGSVLANASNSVGTNSVVLGRLLCITGQITLLSNTITLPPI